MNLIRPPENAQCPRCHATRVSAKGFQLPLNRLLAWASRHIMRLHLRCDSCRMLFWHVHVLPRTIIGYHGCDLDFAYGLLAGEISVDEWKASEHSYDWLGAGIYFWEHAPGRAWQWAREHHPDNPAVIATEVKLGTCLDLADTLFTDLLRQAYDGTMELYTKMVGNRPRTGAPSRNLENWTGWSSTH